MSSSSYFLGLDLSTQQLKGIVVDEDLNTVLVEKVEFDVDFPAYKTVKGVYTNGQEIVAPVSMWIEALDLLLQRLIALPNGEVIVKSIKGISGACQQHGSVFWNSRAAEAFQKLENTDSDLKSVFNDCFSWKMSPNWQDHSTEKECKAFEQAVGGKEQLAEITGSKAHYRFTGPQILKLKTHNEEIYKETVHISLVSSFLASILAGSFAPLDIGDVCGMNLWNLQKRTWEPKLIDLIGKDVVEKLGPVELNGGASVGSISPYFVHKYGLPKDCEIIAHTGDNPGTILAFPLEVNDVIVSLGTSTTALIVTENYVPSSMYHLFTHPTGKGYMGMLCYCNGALAREQIRNEVNTRYSLPFADWTKFDELATKRPALGQDLSKDVAAKIGFYFPLGEIIPDIPSTTKRFQLSLTKKITAVNKLDDDAWTVEDDVVAILESQSLSIRYRLRPMLTTATKSPRRIFFVGGGSKNDAICEVMSRVLAPTQGSYRLDNADACAKGAANKAAYGYLTKGQTAWEAFISSKWDLDTQATEISGPRDASKYEEFLDAFTECESML